MIHQVVFFHNVAFVICNQNVLPKTSGQIVFAWSAGVTGVLFNCKLHACILLVNEKMFGLPLIFNCTTNILDHFFSL